MPLESINDGLNVKEMMVDAPAPPHLLSYDPARDVTPKYRDWLGSMIKSAREYHRYERLVGTAAYCKLWGMDVPLSKTELEECFAQACRWAERQQQQSYFAIQDLGSIAILKGPSEISELMRLDFRQTLLAHVQGNESKNVAEMAFYLAVLGEQDLVRQTVDIDDMKRSLEFFRDPDLRMKDEMTTYAAALRMLGEPIDITQEEWNRMIEAEVLEAETTQVVTDDMPAAAIPAKLAILAAEEVKMTSSGLVLGKKERPSKIQPLPEVRRLFTSMPIKP